MPPRARPSEPDQGDVLELSDRELSRQALRRIAADPNAPAAAQAQAARTLLELAGDLGRNAQAPRDPNTPLAELSRAELEAMLLDPTQHDAA